MIQNNSAPPEMPMGFGMQLMQHPSAMDNFGRLSNTEKHNIVSYIQSCDNGYEAKSRITSVVQKLGNGQSYR